MEAEISMGEAMARVFKLSKLNKREIPVEPSERLDDTNSM